MKNKTLNLRFGAWFGSFDYLGEVVLFGKKIVLFFSAGVRMQGLVHTGTLGN